MRLTIPGNRKTTLKRPKWRSENQRNSAAMKQQEHLRIKRKTANSHRNQKSQQIWKETIKLSKTTPAGTFLFCFSFGLSLKRRKYQKNQKSKSIFWRFFFYKKICLKIDPLKDDGKGAGFFRKVFRSDPCVLSEARVLYMHGMKYHMCS